ncbi:tetratricopeptide repeat protein [Micromonospora narathiwatensis]|uniref:Tetratricopeptide repeat-containing protein n=1 Tax=Micromonospora narathiwatensis TaxID=299146 RepID=A0A1A8ZAY4_9ACTN|nr:tetratricopeptide repeat protein [Micromonospora narathiwatensis]SBT40997.1 Tetratricopeptide repeat-containing protein [Micromonospora narathiwatensis]
MTEQQPVPRQSIAAVAGAAYGVIGADLHIFGDGTPVYLLQRWPSETAVADPAWLRQSPSRMLNARHEVVPFCGRAAERETLHRWRRSPTRLSAHWLYGPGGQGKTRLAARFAEEARTDGWLVVQALHGLGTVLPAPSREDLDPAQHAGVLLVVDYADRWPLSHLTWLFSNSLLHRRDVPARILLIARSAEQWPAIRATLANHMADHASTALSPLPDEPSGRTFIFETARDSFAARYEVTDAETITPPGPLTGPKMGLTLAVHMAALVAVDAAVSGRTAPTDLAGMTVYLIDREQLNWHQLHEHKRGTPTIGTAPETMRRMVFLAALSGAVPPEVGKDLVTRLKLSAGADGLLADHAVCYPAPDAQTFLEPLYPDRLAEDFIALTLPGHTSDYPAASWSADFTGEILNALGSVPGLSPARAVTFMAAAAERWPHVGVGHLYPNLRRNPRLLVTAGSAAMTAVSELPDVDMNALRAAEQFLPAERHVDFDIGAAAVNTRLTVHRLAATDDPGRRGQYHGLHGWRLANAGRHLEALEATMAAAGEYRRAAEAGDADRWLPLLAAALNNICVTQSELGRQHLAREAAEEAVALRRRFAEADPGQRAKLALALNTYGLLLSELGEHEAATGPASESLGIRRELAEGDRRLLPDVASSLTNLGLLRVHLGDLDGALAAVEEAAVIYRDLAAVDPARHLPDLATALNNLGSRLAEVDRVADACAALEEAVSLRRRLVQRNETAFLPSLAGVLNNHGNVLARLGRHTEALASTEESAAIYRRLGQDRHIARVLLNLGNRLADAGRGDEAQHAYEESVRIRRRLAVANPAAHAQELAQSLIAAAGSGVVAEAQDLADEAIDILAGLPATATTERDLAEARKVRHRLDQT